MIIRFCLLSLALCLSLNVVAQTNGDIRALEPGQPVEREIAGGEAHIYQISLTGGQFVRFRLEQPSIDSVLILTAPDGKQMVEMNLTGLDAQGEEESASIEAATAGSYRLTVRVNVTDRNRTATMRGSYRLVAVVRAEATAEDRKRVSAEALLVEANEFTRQRAKAAQQALENLQHALEKLQALPMWRELGEPQWITHSIHRIGFAYNGLGQYGKAIEYAEQALAMYRKARLRASEGDTLRILSGAYSGLNLKEKSLEYQEQALAAYREIKDRWAEGVTLTNLGFFYTVAGQYEKAIDSYTQAAVIHHERKNRDREAAALSDLGNVYFWLGRVDKGIEYYEQALLITRELKNRRSVGFNIAQLGDAYVQSGQTEKAIAYLEESLNIAREVGDRQIEGNSLGRLGAVNFNLGRYEKAIEYSEQAVAIARERKHRISEGDWLRYLGAAYRSLGRVDEAVKSHEQALIIARELKSPMREARALVALGQDERNRGNLARARSLIEDSLTIAESLRTRIVSAQDRSGFLANVQQSYQLYIDILMSQHQTEPLKGLDALAVEVSERKRTRSLLDLLAEARIDVREGVDASLLERERVLGRQLNNKAQELTQATKPEQAAGLKKEVSQLESEYERAQAAIRKVSPHYAALTQPQPLKLKEIQQQLDADTMLLEYALGWERSYLWAITKDAVKSYELPKEAQISPGALRVHELLTARSANKRGESAAERQQRITKADADLPEAAAALSQTLLGPVAAELGKKRLVIVADGALQYVPFAMLPDPSVVSSQLSVAKNSSPQIRSNGRRTTDHGQPLIVNHEVVSLPSASALAIQRSELAGRQPVPKMLAVIADPVFDRADARFTTPSTETTDKTQPQAIGADDVRSIEHLAENSADKSGVTTLRLVIPRLRFTRQEANQLMALAPKGSSFSAIDFQASRTTALDPALGQYRYLHFATHGYLDSERPGLSALVFSMVDAQGKPQNGFLRANDIYNLKLPAELVVLSACQTGLGKEIKGEGLVGLTRGFMYAGAARVVVSLWNVNHKATADLMTKFYEKMLKRGERPAAALRSAQVEMWKQKRWQSPYYWAAFTMQGEWR